MKFRLLPAILLLLPAAAGAQTDDFNDGNDTGWTRFDPITVTTYSVVNGAYRLSTVPSANPDVIGPSRGGSLRQGLIYDRFSVSVDIVEWDASQDASLGIIARVQANPALGTLGCYAVTLNVQDADFGIELVQNEATTNLGGYGKFTMTPGHSYRLIFSGAGSTLEAAIYDIADLSTPLGVRIVEDSTWARGTCGLVAFSDENTAVTGSFDNYRAAEGAAVPDDDFNDGNDTGWTRQTPGSTGTFAFVNGHYRLNAVPTSNPAAIGPARIGSLRSGQLLSDFCVECDIAGGNVPGDASFGLLARVSNPGLGQLNGYTLTWQGTAADLQINAVTGEVPVRISPAEPVAFDPARRYRMVFSGRGSRLEGRLYDLAAPALPLVKTVAFDSSYTSGLAGLLVYDDDNKAASVEFDTWRATGGAPPPLNAAYAAGEVRVWWEHYLALAHDLQTSPDLAAWTPLIEGIQVQSRYSVLPVQPDGHGYFRLVLPADQ